MLLLLMLPLMAGKAWAENNRSVPTGAVNGLFSVSANKKVYFSKGNLQYQASTNTWRFAENQWDRIGTGNSNISSSNTGWIDLFGWGTSGYNHGATCYQPWSTSTTCSNYYAYGSSTNHLYNSTGKADWGYNAILNGGNQEKQWRTLTGGDNGEWEYLLNIRSTSSGIRYAKACVNNINGIIIVPDDWRQSTYTLNQPNVENASFSSNTITSSTWNYTFESAGCVFLPTTGQRGGTSTVQVETDGCYWSSAYSDNENAKFFFFYNYGIYPKYADVRWHGFSVRLVQNCNYDFSALCPTGQTLYYNITDSNTHTVTLTFPSVDNTPWNGYQKPTGDITLPNTVMHNGIQYSVTAIGDNAFYECGLTGSLIIPNSVILIGSNAFTGCGLTSLTIGNSVTTIGSRAFRECYNLTGTLTIPNSVVTIGGGAFQFCHFLGNLIIPNSVTSIGSEAFEDNTGFTGNLVIGNSVTEIGYQSFKGCSGLTGNLVIPNSVTSIGEDAFINCRCFSSLTIGSSVTSIGKSAFQGCSGFIGNLVIPNSVTSIDNSAFQGCSGFTGNLVIPNYVTYIGKNAFLGCNGFTGSLTIGNSVAGIGKDAFGNCTGLNSVLFNATNCTGMGSSDSPVFYGCTNITTLIIGDNVTKIPSEAFSGCNNLTGNLIIPNSITSIGNYAFSSCSNFTSIELSKSIPPTISEYSFNSTLHTIPVHIPCGAIVAYQSASGWSSFTNYQEDFNYTLTVSSSNTNMGTVAVTQQPSCGVNAIVKAIPKTNYRFVNWTKGNNIVSTDAIYTFTVTEDIELVANFAISNYTISATANPAVGGTVTGAGEYNHGANVTLSASANEGYTFVNWTENGTQVSTSPNYSFTASADRTLVANFSLNSYVITASANPTVGGTITGVGEYSQGETVTLTAQPNLRYEFVNWKEGNTVVSTDPTYSFTATANRDLVAIFQSCNYDFSAVCSTGQTLYYNITNNNTHTVGLTYPKYYNNDYWYGYQKPAGDIVLPETVEHENVTYSVALICPYAFYGCSDLTGSLTIPNSMTSINQAAFCGCSGFTGSLTIPNSVTYIGDYSFDCCCGFTGSLTIPNSVTYIGVSTFAGCCGFTGSLTIPNSVTYIGVSTFAGCSGFKGTLTIPNSVTSIRDYAFQNCDFTGSLTIPNSVTSIGNCAFQSCNFTGSLTIPNSVTSIGIQAFLSCVGFTGSLTIPNSVTSIGQSAFYGCIGLTGSLIIPNSVTYIGNDAFSSNDFSSIIVDSENPNFYSEGNAVIRKSDKVLFVGCKSTIIPNDISGIGDYAFAYCSGLMGPLTIPNSVTYIGDYAFSGCSGLTGPLTIPNSVASIGNCAFAGCSGLTSIISKTATPPTAGSVCFNYVSNSIPIQVPCGSVDAYQQAAEWSNFSNYSENILFDIAVASSNEAYGSVEIVQEASCEDNEAIVQATPNSGYTFINWTENGEVVSTEANYCFAVNEDRNLVANFAISNYTISASANPVIGGTVSGAGSYNHGANVTLTATANEGYTFVNWTENNVEVSTSPNYSFTATADRTFVANFVEMGGNHWIPEDSQFASYMNVLCVVNIDGVEQERTDLEIGAFCGEQCRGSKLAQQFPATGRYIFRLAVYGNSGDNITFRLYDHQLQAELDLQSQNTLVWENNGYGGLGNPYVLSFVSSVSISATVNPSDAGTVSGAGDYTPGTMATLTATPNEGFAFLNWTEDNAVVSTDASYSFTVETARALVANFEYVQTLTLANGYNWISPYIEMNDSEGLAMLEQSLGSNGEVIQNRQGLNVFYYEGYGWWGDLEAITNEQMYQVKTTSACEVELVGNLASVNSHPITINEGWNWIGYPLSYEMNTADALSSLTAETDDVIKNRLGFSAYYEGYGWYGDVETMEPGQGYMYKQNASTPQTLTYPTNGRDINMTHVPNGTKHYGTDAYAYSGNMSVVAVAEMGGEELRSEDYELAAFVNGQCRGSVRLLDVTHLNRSLALLTIQGEAGEKVSYRLYDHSTGLAYESLPTDGIEFAKDRVEGSMDSPVTIHFNTTGVEEFETASIDIYPNPTMRNHSISMNLSGILDTNHAIIEIYNAFGQKIREVSSTQSPVTIEGFQTPGMYFVKVITDSDKIVCGKIIVE